MVDTQLALRIHLGLGLFAMAGFSYGFGKNYMQTPLSTNRRFKSGAFLASFLTMFYYLILNVLYNTSNPSLQFMDLITLRHFCWFLTTPLLLADMVFLEASVATDIILLCIVDGIMIISGYIAHIATDPIAIWVMFGFGGLNGGLVIIQMLKYFDKITFAHRQTMPYRTFVFLCWYTLIIWAFFPFLFILAKTNTISYEAEICAYVYLDIFAKGIFGIVLLGARDAITNNRGRMVRFARAVISIIPMDPTDTTVVPTDAEIESMVGREHQISTTERTRTILDAAVADTSITVKPPAPMDTPPPRWQ